MTDALPVRPRSPHDPLVLPLLLGGVLVATIWLLSACPTEGLRSYAANRTTQVKLGEHVFTARTAALYRTGALKAAPVHAVPRQLASDSPEAIALLKTPILQPPPAAVRGDQPPSTSVLPSPGMVSPEMIEVSLVCDSDDLFHPQTGIVTHALEHGRKWERRAWLTARQHGQLLIESPIGIRIHGGVGRKTPAKSFGLFFRRDYGAYDACPPGLFFGPDTPGAEQVLLINADSPDRFLGALATELAAAMGCRTSRLAPAVVYLNGTRLRSPFFLYQWQSPAFVREHAGTARVDWVRLRSSSEQCHPGFDAMHEALLQSRKSSTVASVATRFDNHDLCAWALAVSYTVTIDNDQGAYYRDQSSPEAPWRSLVWDMDGAFKRAFDTAGTPYETFLKHPFPILSGFRGLLFRRLFNTSPAFRDGLLAQARETSTQRLTPERLAGLIARYQHLARLFPEVHESLPARLTAASTMLQSRWPDLLRYLEAMHLAAQNVPAGTDLWKPHKVIVASALAGGKQP